MLQEYLNANFLSLTDDGDFKKLKKSADAITKKIIKSRTKILSYTLTAIDPNLSTENPDVEEVKATIIKNWSTFVTNAKDTPLTYIRAVMLEALSNISEDVNHALLIWFASRNIVEYHNLTGKEKDIILEFIAELGNDINQKANTEWALSNNSNLSKIDFELKDITKYLINEDTLRMHFEDASGPKNAKGPANYESPNPHWPNAANSWSFEFAPRATKGIKNSVDASLKVITAVVNENKNTIQNSLNKALEHVQKSVVNSSKTLQLKSELLWWKEAGYSSSTDKSYDELDKNILGIVLAFDYSSFIPLIYPKSVDYFLKETYKVKGSTEEERTLEDFFRTIVEHKEELKLIFTEEEALVGKSTLLNFIISLVWNKIKLTQFEELVGISLNIKLSPNEVTTWLFHDFQLAKILNTK